VALIAAVTTAGPVVAAIDSPQESTQAYLKRLKVGTAATVYVVFSADCQDCRALSGFYKRIQDLPGVDGVAVRLIALTRGGAGPAQAALRDAGVIPSAIAAFPDEDPAALPTTLGAIAIFGKDGTPVKKWDHVPTTQEQDDVIGTLKALINKLIT
jgi:hypothetical protein